MPSRLPANYVYCIYKQENIEHADRMKKKLYIGSSSFYEKIYFLTPLPSHIHPLADTVFVVYD